MLPRIVDVAGTSVTYEILSCIDVSQPALSTSSGRGDAESDGQTRHSQKTVETQRRLLRLQLTDGKSQCGAFEWQPLGSVSPSYLRPHSQIRLGPATRCVKGMLLLTPEDVEFLGGGEGEPPSKAAEVESHGGDRPPRFTPTALGAAPIPPRSHVATSVNLGQPSAQPVLLAPAAAPAPSTVQQPAAPRPVARTAPSESAGPPKQCTRPTPRSAPTAAAPTAAATTVGSRRPPSTPSKGAAAAATATSGSAVDPELLEQLMSMGLSASEVHAHLGLTAGAAPPTGATASTASAARRTAAGPGGNGRGGPRPR